ncbi:MAG: MATE family efflux transporter [Oscillospiraceae bacterium]
MFSYLRQPKGFYRRLFLLALPIIVQNLITTSLGFLDTFMVGLLGSEQMSAVTVANVPIFIIQLIVFGLQSGSSVLISQYWGRGDRESINRVMGIGFCIAGSVSTLFALIMAFFPADVLLLVTDNLRLVAIGTPYIRIVGFSYILNSLSSIYIGMQRSIENPRFGMLVFGASMLCNTVGNYVLIFGKLGFPRSASQARRPPRCSRAWWNLARLRLRPALPHRAAPMERPSPPGPRDAAPLRALQCAGAGERNALGRGLLAHHRHHGPHGRERRPHRRLHRGGQH